jgi:hypothetical protein
MLLLPPMMPPTQPCAHVHLQLPNPQQAEPLLSRLLLMPAPHPAVVQVQVARQQWQLGDRMQQLVLLLRAVPAVQVLRLSAAGFPTS